MPPVPSSLDAVNTAELERMRTAFDTYRKTFNSARSCFTKQDFAAYDEVFQDGEALLRDASKGSVAARLSQLRKTERLLKSIAEFVTYEREQGLVATSPETGVRLYNKGGTYWLCTPDPQGFTDLSQDQRAELKGFVQAVSGLSPIDAERAVYKSASKSGGVTTLGCRLDALTVNGNGDSFAVRTKVYAGGDSGSRTAANFLETTVRCENNVLKEETSPALAARLALNPSIVLASAEADSLAPPRAAPPFGAQPPAEAPSPQPPTVPVPTAPIPAGGGTGGAVPAPVVIPPSPPPSEPSKAAVPAVPLKPARSSTEEKWVAAGDFWDGRKNKVFSTNTLPKPLTDEEMTDLRARLDRYLPSSCKSKKFDDDCYIADFTADNNGDLVAHGLLDATFNNMRMRVLIDRNTGVHFWTDNGYAASGGKGTWAPIGAMTFLNTDGKEATGDDRTKPGAAMRVLNELQAGFR